MKKTDKNLSINEIRETLINNVFLFMRYNKYPCHTYSSDMDKEEWVLRLVDELMIQMKLDPAIPRIIYKNTQEKKIK